MGQRGAMIKSLFVLQSSVCLSLVVNLDHYVSLQALTKTSSHEKENEYRLTGDSGDDIFFFLLPKEGVPQYPLMTVLGREVSNEGAAPQTA